MTKTAKLPRTTKSQRYDKRFKVTKMINENAVAIEEELRLYQIATAVMTVAMLLAAINFFSK